MIHSFNALRPSVLYLSLFILLTIFLCGCQGTRVEALETLTKLPSPEQALEMSATRYSSVKEYALRTPRENTELEIMRNYDLILARREQLEISNEVKGHFEKAVTQAEKKFEEGDDNISQSSLTKLKLGLSGTLNDISQFKNDIALAKLHLEKYLGVKWAVNVDISDPKFQKIDFPYQSVSEFLKSKGSDIKTMKIPDLFELREAIIAVNKAREQLTLAGKNRKMTRALLVTEAANYDFGIGNEADLFEALIIYTRVLVGYYEALHTFNVSIYRIHSLSHTL